ncbi:MAG: hypothetical protein WDA16_00085 [Candidatus Thermoplasmatota archaeon]
MSIPSGPVHALDTHPIYQNARHTLQGLFTGEADAERAAARLADQKGKLVIAYTLTAPDGSTLYAVAAREPVVRQRRANIPHDRTVPWQAVRIALDAFRSAERETRASGAPLRWYKKLEVDKLRRVLLGYDWSGSKLDVASRMMSTTILTHPFPNANHRTSITLAKYYLASEGVQWPPYSLRGRGIDRFIAETEPHIVLSKYLIQLRRRQPLLCVARAAGYTDIVIKQGFNAKIDAADLELSTEDIEKKHQARCRALIEKIDDGKNADELGREGTRGLREFVAWYFG